jgi:hypothetical protein
MGQNAGALGWNSTCIPSAALKRLVTDIHLDQPGPKPVHEYRAQS